MNGSGRLVTPDGGKIQQLRRAKGLNVEAFADRVGCSKPTVRSVEAGKRCYLYTLASFANALGVECQELMAGEVPEVVRKERRFEVQIKVSVSYDEFDECEQLAQFVELLKRAIGASHEIEVKDLKAGSLDITLEMSEEDITKLFIAFTGGKLDDLRIASITLPRDPDFRLGIEGGPPEWHNRGFTLYRHLPPEAPVEPEQPSPGTPAPPPRPARRYDDDEDAALK